MSDEEQHEFEAFVVCANCSDAEPNCECEEGFDPDELDECDVCGESEEDGEHAV
jgi:hypothetical protein